MSGTTIGGQRAAARNKELYGEDFYQRIGSIGGSRSGNGGFASLKLSADGLTGPERASLVGKLGGRRSRRVRKQPQATSASLLQKVGAFLRGEA